MVDRLVEEKFFGWRSKLDKAGLSGIASTLIEAAGPLNLLAAQGLYLLEPLLRSQAKQSLLADLAEILETREGRLTFAAYLRNTED